MKKFKLRYYYIVPLIFLMFFVFFKINVYAYNKEIIFGSYPQDEVTTITSDINNAPYDSNGDAIINGVKYKRVAAENGYQYFMYQPIVWKVISNDGTYLTLLSKYAIDCQPFDNQARSYTTTGIQAIQVSSRSWEESSIRSWLNGYGANYNTNGCDFTKNGTGFINTAFTDDETKAIRTTQTSESANDKVYLLSTDEVKTFLPEVADRKKTPTSYAKCVGVFVYEGDTNKGGVRWLLRTILKFIGESKSQKFSAVEVNGNIYDHVTISEIDIGVCPAIQIREDAVKSYQLTEEKKIPAIVVSDIHSVDGEYISVSFESITEADGYEISYSPVRNFTKDTKILTIKDTNAYFRSDFTEYCYIRIRAYKNTSNGIIYGSYSGVTKVFFRKAMFDESKWKNWQTGSKMICPEKNASPESVLRYVYDFVESKIGDSGYEATLRFEYKGISYDEFHKIHDEIRMCLDMYRTGCIASLNTTLSQTSRTSTSHTAIVQIKINGASGDWRNKLHELADMAMSSADTQAGQIVEYLIWLGENSYYEGSMWGYYTSSPIFLNGRGVCAHYAAAFKDFCDAVGIPSTIVEASYASPSHAFNSVYLDGHWYLIDTTGMHRADNESYMRSNAFYYVTSLTLETHYKGYYNAEFLKAVQEFVLKSFEQNKPISKNGQSAQDINMRLNGATVMFTDAYPFIDDNGRTQIPVRALSDVLGLEIQWYGDTQTITLSKDGVSLVLKIGSSDLVVSNNGSINIYSMDTEPIIIGSRTYLPARYIAERFGYTVAWDGKTRSVIISDN